MDAESAISCIEMFLANREQCGVPTDAAFVIWLVKHIRQYKEKKEKMLRAWEKANPD